MAGGVSFAGKGSEDVGSAVDTAFEKDTARGKDNTVEFAGNGAQDVAHSTDNTDHANKSVPEGGEVQFAGNVGK